MNKIKIQFYPWLVNYFIASGLSGIIYWSGLLDKDPLTKGILITSIGFLTVIMLIFGIAKKNGGVIEIT